MEIEKSFLVKNFVHVSETECKITFIPKSKPLHDTYPIIL